MCGIFGYKNKKNKNLNFHNFLKHRGPDYEKKICYKDFTLGHNLLAIRDNVQNSIQPVETLNNRYIFCFNGQIYNTDYLKKKFSIDKNIILDTKIITKVIEKVNLDFITYIKGMFAIALIDKKLNKLFLYRDQSGQKPIYYSTYGNTFIFSSEIQPILKDMEKVSFNEKVLPEILDFGYTINSNTSFKNIFKVLPGQLLSYDLQNHKITKNFFSQNKKNDFNLIQNEINNNINQTTQSQNKIAINISGGLDSNVILYETLKYKKNLKLFVCKYDCKDDIYNLDFEIAQKVAKEFNLELNVTEISQKDYLENFLKSKSILSESNRNISDPIYYLNYKHQNQHGIRSVMTGDGGDELFVGYSRYFIKNIFRFFFSILSKYKYKRDFKTIINIYKQNYYNYTLNKNINKFIINKNLINANDHIIKLIENFENYTNNFYNFSSKKDYRLYLMLLDNFLWQSNEAFLRNDNLGMYFSIETRSPFLEYDLKYSYYKNLPKDIFDKEENKYYLRSAYKMKLNKLVISNKKKLGWTVPREWLKSNKLRNIVLENLPQKNDDNINWKGLTNYLHQNNNFMLDKSLYGLIFLGIHLKEKNNVQ